MNPDFPTFFRGANPNARENLNFYSFLEFLTRNFVQLNRDCHRLPATLLYELVMLSTLGLFVRQFVG